MIITLLLISSLLTVGTLGFTAEDVLPCTYKPVAEVHCSGREITDQVLKHVSTVMGPIELNILAIHDTDLTSIKNNTFPDAVVENIVISNNSKLTTIDPNAFKMSPAVKNVVIQHNHLLADSKNVFAAIRNLNPSQGFYVQYNGFTEIPANAFAMSTVESRLTYMYLDNNKIQKIGANAFTGHSNLAFLDLDGNQINHLDANALNLTLSTYGQHLLYIYINNNNITNTSFAANVFGDQKNSIGLDLEFNHLTTLPQSVFEPFINHLGSTLFLYGNQMTCSCELSWVLPKAADNQIRGLYCYNLQKSIEGLSTLDIGCAA